MKYFFALLVLTSTLSVFAEDKMKMNYVNEEITKIIQDYSKVSGQKFVIDSTVRGKITILNQSEIPLTEAFNQISVAMALNGFAILTQQDLMIIRNARSAQRDGTEVYASDVPSVRPQRMVTWIYTPKHITAFEIQAHLRLLTSSYGEIATIDSGNQLIVQDFTGNIQRISEILKTVDRQTDAATAKIVALAKKNRPPMKQSEVFRKLKGEKSAPPTESETN